MGLLNFFFGKTKKIDDPFFGEMKFVEGRIKGAVGYFECSRHFTPSKQLIQICIDGDLTGPTEKQVAFYKTIEENYTIISAAIIPLIEEQFRNWKEDFAINDFMKEFEPVFLRISRCHVEPVDWEIAFESEHDRNHTFTLTMQNFEAKDILIDG